MMTRGYTTVLCVVSVLAASGARQSQAATRPAPAPNTGMAGDLGAILKPKPKTTPPPPTARKGQLYRHVIGFSFWHPTGWRVKELDNFLQLVPPKPATTPQGPSEVYFVVGDSVAGQGIVQPGDYRVVQYLDQTIRGISPTLMRVGKPTQVPTSKGQGVLLHWQGRSATGQMVHAKAYVTLLKDHGVSLIALGLPDALKPRENDLRQMFASFGLGQGSHDPQLVGKWRLLGTASITNWSTWETHWSRAQLVSETKSVLIFYPNSTWTRTDKTHMIAGAGGTWLEQESVKADQGRWNAGNGALYMVSKDNSWDDFRYQIVHAKDGVQLRMASGTTGQAWRRIE